MTFAVWSATSLILCKRRRFEGKINVRQSRFEQGAPPHLQAVLYKKSSARREILEYVRGPQVEGHRHSFAVGRSLFYRKERVSRVHFHGVHPMFPHTNTLTTDVSIWEGNLIYRKGIVRQRLF